MNRNRTRVRAWMAAACGALLLATAPHALAWPDRPIKIVVGYAAGGIADAGARIVAQRLQEKYGQAVTIDNKAGAAGRLATDAVAKAEPDGYTILLAVGGDTVVAASDPKLPYNLLRDFRFASTLSVYPFLLMSSPSSRTPTLQALFDVAHKNPGGVTYATPGLGTTQHLTGELFAARAKIELTPAPYRGSAAAMTDVAAGRVDFAITALGTQGGEIQAGRYKVLAVTSKARLPSMPQVPTVAETLPGFEVVTWMGLAVPARTPATIVEQISRDVREVMAIPAVRERFAGLGADPQSSTPAEFQARVEADIARWKELIATRKLNLSQ